MYCLPIHLETEYAGRSLECWCNFISACYWENPIQWKQPNTGLIAKIFLICFLYFCKFEVVPHGTSELTVSSI